MSPPGARGPPGRGAPSHHGHHHRPSIDRTSSLPNLELTATSEMPPAASSSHRVSEGRGQGRQIATNTPASPTTQSQRYSAPTKCRPVPNTPVPADRKITVKTPESSFSKISPPTRTDQRSSMAQAGTAHPSRPPTQQPRSTTASASSSRSTSSKAQSYDMHPNAPRAPVPPRSTTRTTPVAAPIQVAASTTSNMPAPRSVPTSRPPAPLLNPETQARIATRDPRINKNQELRHQRAAQVGSSANHGSPAPPRTAAYDSPAPRSGQSSLSGSSTSLASYGRRADLDVDEETEKETETPTSPNPSMDLDLDFQAGGRALRRRRSSDELAEEAKRYCPSSQYTRANNGKSAKSPTFAEAVRRSPSPGPSAATTAPRRETTGVSEPVANAPNPDAAPTQAKKKRPRYPPLVVEKLPNWATHFRALAAKLGRPPNARPFGQGVRFSPESEDEYRVVQRYLIALEKQESISWFAYSLQAEKKLKVAIRGLPPDTDPQEIEEELRRLGYEPEYVRHINARQGRPGCVFHAVLNKTENVRAIYDTSVFLFMRGVKIEAWRGKRGPAQCHRCQKFRHSSHQCHRPLACVRCGEGHTARDCPRPREEPATCANCGGPHPASHIKCPIFQKEIAHRRMGTVAITNPARRPQKVAQVEERPEEEAQNTNAATTLMAAANGPTQRGDAASSSGRRKKKRGGKGRKPHQPPATQEKPPRAAPAHDNVVAQVVKSNENKNKNISNSKHERTSAAATNNQRHLADKVGTNSCTDQSGGARKTMMANQKLPQNESMETTERKKNFTTCAIQLLMDLIKAIRQGQDVEQVILDGLAALLTLYHG